MKCRHASSIRQSFGRTAAALVLAAVFFGWHVPTQAQEAKSAATKDQADPKSSGTAAEPAGDMPKVQVERGAGGKKVYVIKTGFVIEGRIQKPNAFYVLQRSQINYDWTDLKQEFVPKILGSVKKSPF